jgi:hypothetical protein
MRIHAMLCYRQKSFKNLIETSMQLETFQVESWLNYHGEN